MWNKSNTFLCENILATLCIDALLIDLDMSSIHDS